MAPGMPPSMESVMSALPPNVDPFAYIEDVTLSQLALNASQYLTGILMTFLVFHSMIFVFCLFMLVMSSISGARQARWLVRSLYIKDQSGEKVYQSPLYLFNAGILMALWQLFGSVASAAYIWIQKKSSEATTDQVLHAKIVPPLAAMFVFEILSFWTLTHCFLVTAYASRQFNVGLKKGVMRWISPPIIINFFFAGFAVFVVIAVAGMGAWTTFNHHRLAVEVMQILELLKQGSWAWKKLHGELKPSQEEIALISSHLAEVTSQLKQISSDLGPHIEEISLAFHWCMITMFVIACITSSAFIPAFFLLVRRYQPSAQPRPSSVVMLPRGDYSTNRLKQRKNAKLFGINSVSSDPNSIRTLLMNKQFAFLLLRAIGVLLSMMSQLISILLMLIRTREVITVKSWRDLVAWIVIAGGAWSAIPLMWQCWRLYIDQTNDSTSKRSNNCSSKNSTQCHLGVEPSQSHDIELEIKLPEMYNH